MAKPTTPSTKPATPAKKAPASKVTNINAAKKAPKHPDPAIQGNREVAEKAAKNPVLDAGTKTPPAGTGETVPAKSPRVPTNGVPSTSSKSANKPSIGVSKDDDGVGCADCGRTCYPNNLIAGRMPAKQVERDGKRINLCPLCLSHAAAGKALADRPTCICGCNGVVNPGKRFVQGHDARVKSLYLRSLRGENVPALPPAALAYAEGALPNARLEVEEKAKAKLKAKADAAKAKKAKADKEAKAS